MYSIIVINQFPRTDGHNKKMKTQGTSLNEVAAFYLPLIGRKKCWHMRQSTRLPTNESMKPNSQSKSFHKTHV